MFLCLCLQQAEGAGSKDNGANARARHLQAHAVTLSDNSEMSCPGSLGSGSGASQTGRRTCSIPEEHEVRPQFSRIYCRLLTRGWACGSLVCRGGLRYRLHCAKSRLTGLSQIRPFAVILQVLAHSDATK